MKETVSVCFFLNTVYIRIGVSATAIKDERAYNPLW